MKRGCFAALAATSFFSFSAQAGVCPENEHGFWIEKEARLTVLCTPRATDYPNNDIPWEAINKNGTVSWGDGVYEYREKGTENLFQPTTVPRHIYGNKIKNAWEIENWLSAGDGLGLAVGKNTVMIPEVFKDKKGGSRYFRPANFPWETKVSKGEIRLWIGEGRSACQQAQKLSKKVKICVRQDG